MAEELVGLVVVEIRLPEIFHVFRIVLVQFDDFLDERFITRKIGAVQKTPRIEVIIDERVAPINREASGHHGLEDFFGGVPGQGSVFKGDIELVWLEEVYLRKVSPG